MLRPVHKQDLKQPTKTRYEASKRQQKYKPYPVPLSTTADLNHMVPPLLGCTRADGEGIGLGGSSI